MPKAIGPELLNVNQAARIKDMIRNANTVLDRILDRRDGLSFSGNRDLYEAFGYPRTLDYSNFIARYRRGDIAKAVIDAPAKASWREAPDIFESDDDQETPFEKRLAEILKKHKVYSKLQRLDRLSCIGEYAVLLIGANDGLGLDQPLDRATDLKYLGIYSRGAARVTEWDISVGSERFNQPLKYEITVGSGDGNTSKTVHWSRVIHVAYDALDHDDCGTPVLEAIWNRLEDLQRVAGASGESFWRNALAGLFLKTKDNGSYNPDTPAGLEIKEMAEEFVHLYKRFMVLDGLEPEQLPTQVADPGPTISSLLDLIAGTTRIPKRILMGSEVGQLASSQDISNWLAVIDERRKQHCEPNILRPFIDRLIGKKILPEPKDGYSVEWPPLSSQSDKEKAEVAQIRTSAFVAYANAPAAEDMMSPRSFFKYILGLSDDVIDLLEQEALAQIAEDQRTAPEPTAAQDEGPADA